MSLDSRFPMLDLAAGIMVLPIWAAAIIGVLLLLLLFLAIARAGARDVIGSVVRVGLVVLGAAAVLTLAQWLKERDRVEMRRALDQRVMDVSAQAMESGSALGCLARSFGEGLDVPCEKAVFAGPGTLGAASAYVDASLALLAEAYASGIDPNTDAALLDLRRMLENDRFGLVAAALAARNGCITTKCERLAIFAEPKQIRANLEQHLFETLLARHAALWQPTPSVAQAAPGPGPAPPLRRAPGINFPSASSIPAVSIMTNEPTDPPVQQTQAPKHASPPARPQPRVQAAQPQ